MFSECSVCDSLGLESVSHWSNREACWTVGGNLINGYIGFDTVLMIGRDMLSRCILGYCIKARSTCAAGSLAGEQSPGGRVVAASSSVAVANGQRQFAWGPEERN